jgi:hypothetical protein
MDTKEIVALMEKWLEQIKQITVDYKSKIDELEKAKQEYEKQKKKWYNTVLPYFLPIITIIVVIFAFAIAIKFVGCPNPIHITFQDLELTQTCTKP